jgi:hypothetical protein
MSIRRAVKIHRLRRLRRSPVRQSGLQTIKDFTRYYRLNREPLTGNHSPDHELQRIADKQEGFVSGVRSMLKKQREDT